MAIFGASGPDTGPRWWDYLFGLGGGNAPSAVNEIWKQRAEADQDRQIAQAQAAQTSAMRNGIYKEAFGNDFGGNYYTGRGPVGASQTPASPSGYPGSQIPAMPPQQAPVGPVGASQMAPTPSMAATYASGPSAPPMLPTTAPVQAAPGAFGRGANTAYTGDDGNLLYKADGSPRSYQELQNDRRFIALQSIPEAQGMLKAWSDAAQARAPKWDFHNDQYFNINGDDPTAGSHRVGTGMDKDTGIYTNIGPNGQVIAQGAAGFNPLLAGATTAKATAQNNADVAMYGQKKGIDLNYDPQIEAGKAAADAQVKRKFEPGTQAAILAAQAPYQLETVQGPDGPVATSRAQALAAAGGAPLTGIQGRSDSTLNKIRTATEAENDKISTLGRTNNLIQQNIDMLGKGGLQLGPVQNLIHKGQLAAGIQDPQAANYNSFMGNMNLLRDQTLSLQKGTQTEGDAQRAMAQLMTAYSDNNEKAVAQRLQEIQTLNNKAIQESQQRIRQRTSSAAVAPLTPISQQPTYADRLAEARARGLIQ